MRMNLGVVYNKDGKIVNHRSLIKVIFNPFLRLFGIQIATQYDKERNKLCKPVITKTKKIKKVNFNYSLEDGWTIKKERIIA